MLGLRGTGIGIEARKAAEQRIERLKVEIWTRRKDGQVYPEWLAISRMLGADGQPTHYVGVFSDISRHKEAEARIERLAH